MAGVFYANGDDMYSMDKMRMKEGMFGLVHRALWSTVRGNGSSLRKTYGGLKGMWSIPAGFVNGNETADMAAIREVKEETGIDCRLEGMIGFRTGVLNGEISDNMAIFFLAPDRRTISLNSTAEGNC